MTLQSRIRESLVGKSVTITRIRIETRPNGFIELFDFGSKTHLLVDMNGKRRGGSLPLTDLQIRALLSGITTMEIEDVMFYSQGENNHAK